MRLWGVRERLAPTLEVEPGELKAELQDAYRRGRKDERLTRRRSPLLVGGLLAIAAIGAVILYYAAREGSFTGGGQVVDAKLGHVTGEVVPAAINNAASATGSALRSAGEKLKDQGAKASQQASNPPASN